MTRAIATGMMVAATALLTACGVTPLDRGVAFYRQGRYAEALAAFDEAVRLGPGSVAAYNDRGVARVRVGDARGAIGDYTRALELAPNDAGIMFNRGNAHAAVGNYRGAIADFTRAAELRPSYAAAYWNRGVARAQLGELEAARADWRHAITTETNPRVKAAMERRAALDDAATPPAPPQDNPR